jgi:hypothetical protein
MAKGIKPFMVLALGLLLLLPGPAGADLVPVGDPMITGSWTQGFYENGIYGSHLNFDSAIATCLSGSGFETASGSGGWTTSFDSQHVTFSAGPGGGGDLPFSLSFLGSLGDPCSFEWSGYECGQQVFRNEVCWDGGNWECVPQCPSVPLPPTVLLLGSGLLGLVGLRRFRKN